MNTLDLMARLQEKYPGESEYLQAVREVLETVEDVYNQHPEFEKAKIIERMVEPDRIFTFRVTWVDDSGQVRTNTGYRVQFNGAIGPYKGGLRFHKAVTPQIPRLRTDLQERADHTSDGRGQGWLGLRPCGQERCGDYALLPGIYAGIVALHRPGSGHSCR